jgi:hypothetical protein
MFILQDDSCCHVFNTSNIGNDFVNKKCIYRGKKCLDIEIF